MSGAPATARGKLAVPLQPLVPRLELEPPVQQLLAGLASVEEGLARLEAEAQLMPACRLVAHALPKREAVWWACMCARAVPDEKAVPLDAAALEAAETWVRRPDEAARRACMAAAEKSNFRSTEAWAAVGAFWSGGSMAPEGQPVIPPGDHLTGTAIAGAVILAGVRRTPQHLDARLTRFLASAREIAAGGAGRMPVEA
ncbi:MAG: hypothetical protein K2X74_20755 [Acetobacteraceae bacterium]|nr:hypothetical protein [Acetobacteraceae bacterium]